MLQTTLLVLIGIGVVVIALVQRSHARWVKREFHKNTMAHTRIVKQLPMPTAAPFVLVPADRRRTRVWPWAKTAAAPEDWSDDFTGTQEMGVID